MTHAELKKAAERAARAHGLRGCLTTTEIYRRPDGRRGAFVENKKGATVKVIFDDDGSTEAMDW